MAVTPMDANLSGLTASLMWISSLEVISKFNRHLMTLTNTTVTPDGDTNWQDYTYWLRRYACCKKGSGIMEDSAGNGLRPFKINEMTILANYHRVFPDRLLLFPILPRYEYYKNKYSMNGSNFSPGGGFVGKSLYVESMLLLKEQEGEQKASTPSSADGDAWDTRIAPADEVGSLFDPGSWGQFLGGTSMHRGSNPGFTASSHIIGQAVNMNQCISQMRCGNVKSIHYMPVDSSGKVQCYQAPFVRCGRRAMPEDDVPPPEMTTWHPLLHLHVHSKALRRFSSESTKCDCEAASVELEVK